MDKKHLYKIAYSTYEESDSVELFHTSYFSKKDFNNMFIDATVELLKNRRDQHPFLKIFEEGEGEDTSGHSDGWTGGIYARFTHILDIVADIMIELYGFKRVEYEQSVDVDGWGDIVNHGRSFGKDDKILKRIAMKFWEE